MEIESNSDNWQVEAGGKTYDTHFDEMKTWIAEGSLLRIDRVRKGDLRWIEAGKVPSLTEFFNAKDAAEPPPPIVTTTATEVLGVASQPQRFDNKVTNAAASGAIAADPTEDACAMHPDRSAIFVCGTCASKFCKACPKSYGGSVKICPFCGAMCKRIEHVAEAKAKTDMHARAKTEGFGLADFGRALVYPFKFKVSLIFGAILFTIFSMGQAAVSFGGIFMMAAAIMCFMLSNMLTFGVLANTVENFSQGKLDENFMPSFDEFALWDDVVHPLFLSIGVYLSSFGPFIAVVAVAVYMVVGSAQSGINPIQADAAHAVAPEVSSIGSAAKQTEQIKDLFKQAANEQKKRMELMEQTEQEATGQTAAPQNGGVTNPGNGTNTSNTNPPVQPQAPSAAATNPAEREEEYFKKTNQMIQDQQRAQLESAFGKTPETAAKEREAIVQKVLGYGTLFLVLGGLALLWGLFYFPAACAVAGYTRSFGATMNPTVGLDTIKRLGVSYVLILVMTLVLLIASAAVAVALGSAFSAFDLPGLGNIPAKAVGSLFAFYISIVFSCILGYALYKAADRLQLPG